MGAILRFLAIALSAVVAMGFLLFAVEEIDRGSKAQQQALGEQTGKGAEVIVDPAPTPEQEDLRERQHSDAREAIDDANDLLLAPFSNVISSTDRWVVHGLPALMALLVYGLGLSLLANFLPKSRTHAGDWRTA